MYHYIELNDFDASRGYRVYKMLQERLQKRRRRKNKKPIVGYLLKSDFRMLSLRLVVEGLEYRQYTPRASGNLFVV